MIGIKNKLQGEFIGVDGLEQHHIDNIDSMEIINAEQFEAFCGLPA